MSLKANIEEFNELVTRKARHERTEALKDYDSDKNNPNYNFLLKSLSEQKYEGDKIVGGYRGVVLEGSSRSAKTWSGIDLIIFICTELETSCVINIVRETYAEFKDTLYDDFKRRLDDFDLPNPFHHAKEVKSFKIGKNKISFLGCDKIGKSHGAGCDYLFGNEGINIPKSHWDQLEMRCRKFWWMDYNPSVTEHWIFNSIIPRKDVGFFRSTFIDNHFISTPERNKILSYEPWKPGSCEVIDNLIMYNGAEVTEKNQPPPHILNIEQGTADEFMWKVYGLGLRGAMKGLIFKYVTYIDEFPEHIAFTYGMDFGFTVDPTALVKHAEDEHNIYLELLSYEPMDDDLIIHNFMESIGVSKYTPITADSSDRYTSEAKGSFQMVSALRERGWEITKVVKTKGVMFWLNSMKKKKIHIVRNHLYKQARKEQENYRLKEINGIPINQPEDKFNHFFDSSRYSHMAHGYNTMAADWN